MASMRRARQRRIFTQFRPAIVGVAALIGLGAATDASAQFVYGYARAYPAPDYDDDLPLMAPRAVVYRLQDRGFTEIARPRFDGRSYVVDATNPAGNRVRLFVDARDGGVIGRQRLDSPYYPSGRVARAAPGYGWTEEDVAPRRSGRDTPGLLPPADIPLPRPSLHSEIDRGPGAPYRSGAADPNPSGINPDARGSGRVDLNKSDKARAAAAQRRTAKLTPPVKPSAPHTAPEPPAPQTSPAPQAAPAASPAPESTKTTAIEPSKADIAPLTPAANPPAVSEKPPETPAQPQSNEKPVTEPAVTEKPAEKSPAEPKTVADKTPAAKEAPNQGWQDVPASESKRNVRVIGGPITVPGGGEAAPASTAN